MIVCDLLVIVTYAYRILNRKPASDQEDDDDYSSPTPTVSTSIQPTAIDHSATSQQFTTIELHTFAESSASETRD